MKKGKHTEEQISRGHQHDKTKHDILQLQGAGTLKHTERQRGRCDVV